VVAVRRCGRHAHTVPNTSSIREGGVIMNFRITGRVTEKESGSGVPKLVVRAYDRDLLYDDLLGAAVTDAEGRFEMLYTEEDFRELFEKRPDIYLAVRSLCGSDGESTARACPLRRATER
jgi:hypothetical protein